MNKGYFTARKNSKLQEIPMIVTESIETKSLKESLALLTDKKYLVVVHMMQQLLIGRYENGSFVFANGEDIEEKYIIDLRLFNEKEELFIKKNKNKYINRHIVEGEGTLYPYKDVITPFIGERIKAKGIAEGFCRLFEKNRKMTREIPVDDLADHYRLHMRSYVTYDEQTGQAGYGYNRYVNIVSEDNK